ncbi:MAG: SDR family NAD(P)-dependent oxidoreductase [Paracoccaceae bacterium]
MTRTALVTGAGQNIGRAVAVALAKDGFNVVVNGLTNREAADETARHVEAAGTKALVAMGDTGTRDGCNAMAQAAIDAFGRVDVLVHNAAIRPSSPFLEIDEADWERVMNVNLMGSFWLARACLPGMVEAGWGRVILFAGMNAIHGYNGRAHVSVSKHGNWGLTKSLGKEFGSKGITTNMISPGPIRSDAWDEEQKAHVGGMVSRVPVGRLGEPDEIGAVASMLASDKGGFVNGQIIQVNGGSET